MGDATDALRKLLLSSTQYANPIPSVVFPVCSEGGFRLRISALGRGGEPSSTTWLPPRQRRPGQYMRTPRGADMHFHHGVRLGNHDGTRVCWK